MPKDAGGSRVSRREASQVPELFGAESDRSSCGNSFRPVIHGTSEGKAGRTVSAVNRQAVGSSTEYFVGSVIRGKSAASRRGEAT
jgi:hypothetical protein